MKAGSKDLRALQRRLVGCHLVADGKAKAIVVDDVSGLPLRYADGRPVTFPNSPTEPTVRDLTSRLRRLGAIR